MILVNVTLSNFKKHKSLSVDLQQGLNTIVGPNYAGKSTIQQAILFALFGPSTVPGKVGDLVTKGTTTKPQVTLEFTTSEHEYTLVREGSDCTLATEEGVISRGASPVSTEIAQIMGVSKDQFLKTRVSKQGDAHALLSTSTQELKKLVEALSGCDIVDGIQKSANLEVKTNKDKIESLNSVLDPQFNPKEVKKELEVQIIEAETTASELLQVEKAITEGAQTLRTDEDEKARITQEVANQEATRTRLETAARMVAEAKSNVESLAKVKSVVSDVDKEESNLAELEAARTELEERDTARDQAAKSLSELEVENKTLLEQVESLVEPSVDEDLDSLKDSASDTQAQILSHNVTLKSLQTLLDGGTCTTCGRVSEGMTEEDLQAHQTAFDLETTNLSEASTVAASIADKIAQTEGQLKSLEAYKANQAKYTEGLDSISTRIEECEGVLSSTKEVGQAEYDALSDKITELAQAISEYKLNASLLARYQKDLGTYEQEEVELSKSLQPVEGEASLPALAEKIQQGAKLVSELKVREVELRSANKVGKARVELLESGLAHHTTVTGKIQTLTKDGADYFAISKTIKDNRADMLEGVWSGLLLDAGAFANACTSGDITEVGVDDKFNIIYQEAGYTFPIDSASGAQKSLIALGLRVAIANLLPSNVEFLLLDEVGSDMRDDVAVLVMANLKAAVPQTLSVSHRALDTLASDSVIALD